MVFLGVLVDTTDMTVSVTPDCLSELRSRCTSLLSVTHLSRHDLQSLLGVMSFVTSCVRPARVFMSSLLYTLRTYRLSKYCPLSSVNHSDLHWWRHFLPSYNGVSLIKTSPWLDNRLFLSTDACRTGAGGYFTGQYFHTPFPAPILSQFGHDINILELLTIMVALKLWGELLRGQHLILQCDNANSVLAINSGRSRVPGMHLCLREIWFLTARHDIDIFAGHIAGVDNRFDALTADTPTTHILCPSELFQFEIDCLSGLLSPSPGSSAQVPNTPPASLYSQLQHIRPMPQEQCATYALSGILSTFFAKISRWFLFQRHLRPSPPTRFSSLSGPLHTSIFWVTSTPSDCYTSPMVCQLTRSLVLKFPSPREVSSAFWVPLLVKNIPLRPRFYSTSTMFWT